MPVNIFMVTSEYWRWGGGGDIREFYIMLIII